MESERYLLSLGNEVETMKLGLENIRRLLAELGSPHEKYLKVQVAGTNGKGSVCAFLNSICVTAGVRTGLYTSPHLVSITERVRIDGVEISQDEFSSIATRVRSAAEHLFESGELTYIPTFFEQVTAIALVAFARADVELAILETGLGGRLDATTAANAEIAAITRIDLDHQKYLGDTLQEIAAEKAAIIHKGSRVVIGEQEPRAMEIVLDRCRDLEVVPVLASKVIATPPLGLPGRHQAENARVAIVLADLVNEHFEVNSDHVSLGLARARHPGRLERVGRFLFDGAHNPGGAKALRDYLDEFITQPITMIFGAMGDKDIDEIAAILFPKADKLILTRGSNTRSATPSEILSQLPAEIDRKAVTVTGDVAKAIDAAVDASSPDALIVITGSLYLVGEARAKLVLSE